MSTCAICPLHLESGYPALLCPSCLANELLVQAGLIAGEHVRNRRFDLVERVYLDLGTRAEQVLLEDPVALATY